MGAKANPTTLEDHCTPVLVCTIRHLALPNLVGCTYANAHSIPRRDDLAWDKGHNLCHEFLWLGFVLNCGASLLIEVTHCEEVTSTSGYLRPLWVLEGGELVHPHRSLQDISVYDGHVY